MAWTALSVNPPTPGNAADGAALSVQTATPWQHGEGLGVLSRLSFPSAAASVSGRIEANRPTLAIAVTAAAFPDLVAQCAGLAAAFPFPALLQWQRRALALANLAVSKLSLVPEQAVSGGLSLNALPAIAALQNADLRQAAYDAAETFKSSDPLTSLTDFAAEKAAHDAEVASAHADAGAGLTGGAGWRFYADSDVSNAILSGTPGHEYTMTCMMVFQAPDLSLLTEIFP